MKLLEAVSLSIALALAGSVAVAQDQAADVRRFEDLPAAAQAALLDYRAEARSQPYACYGLNDDGFRQALGPLVQTDYNGDGLPDFIFRSPCRAPDPLDGRLEPSTILLSNPLGYRVGRRFDAALGVIGGQRALLVETPCAEGTDPADARGCYLARTWDPAARNWSNARAVRLDEGFGPAAAPAAPTPTARPLPPAASRQAAPDEPAATPVAVPLPVQAPQPRKAEQARPATPPPPAPPPAPPPPPQHIALAGSASPSAPAKVVERPPPPRVDASPTPPPRPAPPVMAAAKPAPTSEPPRLKNEITVAQPVRPQPRAGGELRLLPVNEIKPLRDHVIVASSNETAFIVLGGPYEREGFRTLRVVQLLSPEEGQTLFQATIDLIVVDEEVQVDCAGDRVRVNSAIQDTLLGRNPRKGSPEPWAKPEASWEKLYRDFACYGVQPYTTYQEGNQYPTALSRFSQYPASALARNRRMHDGGPENPAQAAAPALPPVDAAYRDADIGKYTLGGLSIASRLNREGRPSAAYSWLTTRDNGERWATNDGVGMQFVCPAMGGRIYALNATRNVSGVAVADVEAKLREQYGEPTLRKVNDYQNGGQTITLIWSPRPIISPTDKTKLHGVRASFSSRGGVGGGNLQIDLHSVDGEADAAECSALVARQAAKDKLDKLAF